MTPRFVAEGRARSTRPASIPISLALFVGLVRLHCTRWSLIMGGGLAAGLLSIAMFVGDGVLFVAGTTLMLAGLLLPSAPTLFEHSSRVPPRVLLMARLCAHSLLVFPALGVALTALRVSRATPLAWSQWLQFWCLAGIAVAAPFLLHATPAFGGDRAQTPRSVHAALMTVLVCAPLCLLFLPAWLHLPSLALLTALCLAAAFVVWPRAFVACASARITGPAEAGPASKTDRATYEQTWFDRWPAVAQLVGTLRIVSARRRWWFWLFHGLTLLNGYWVGLSNTVVLAAVVTGQLLVRETRFLSVLAISPARRLAGILLVGPVALLLLTGVGAGARAAYEHLARPAGHVDMGHAPWIGAPFHEGGTKGFRDPSRVSAAFWEWAPRGAAPEIVAPWGERVRPHTMEAFGRTMYNPFSVRPANSARFYAWQWQRLLRAVYGAPVVRTLDEPFPWPPAVTERWTVRLIMGALLLAGSVAITGLAWSARNGSVVRMLIVQAVFLLTMLHLPLLQWFVPEARPGFTTQVLQGRILDLIAWLPAGPWHPVLVVGAAGLPLLLVSAWLWRSARPVVFEFDELRRT